ncbi:MAG: type II secretion system F family protein [Acidimicrobiales bacterium]
MADTYVYRARASSGEILKGSVEGDSMSLVVAKLREMGHVPLAIDIKDTTGLKRELSIPGLGGRVKVAEIATFSRQFATMVNSGLTLLRSLNILVDQTDDKVLKRILGEVRTEVEGGSSLSHALGRHPKVFSQLYVSMVRSGEVAGTLDTVLVQLANTIEKQVELKRKIKSALTYPITVLALVLVILTAMLVFVVPTFKGIYKSLGGTLPLPTRILISVSNVVVNYFPLVILAIGIAAFGLKRWVQSEKGRAVWDAAKLRIWLFGKLIHKTALTRFCRTLASLLRSGVPILESLEITKDTVGNTVMASAIADIQDGVRQGEAIARRLPDHKVFPPMLAQMLAVGEETGAVDSMLDKVGDFYEQQVEAMVAALTSLLEPALITVLGGAVGSMVISLYLPMFDIIKLIK